VYTPINFPLASSTTAFGINDNGDIAGWYNDAAGKTHGFVYADNNFSTVDVAGASATQLTRIKNWDQVTGLYTDALSENHGLISR
jgi:probable HAF family extracellular repeat protein